MRKVACKLLFILVTQNTVQLNSPLTGFDFFGPTDSDYSMLGRARLEAIESMDLGVRLPVTFHNVLSAKREQTRKLSAFPLSTDTARCDVGQLEVKNSIELDVVTVEQFTPITTRVVHHLRIVIGAQQLEHWLQNPPLESSGIDEIDMRLLAVDGGNAA